MKYMLALLIVGCVVTVLANVAAKIDNLLRKAVKGEEGSGD